MKILILEDEAILRHTIIEFLESLEHTVTGFADGESAKNALLVERFDLLLLDINVPKLNGFELLRTIREERIDTPVIYVSALVDIEDITKGFTLGCADYLKKPFHLRELELRIDNLNRLHALQSNDQIPIGKNYSYHSKRPSTGETTPRRSPKNSSRSSSF